jgi:hypothetical protein
MKIDLEHSTIQTSEDGTHLQIDMLPLEDGIDEVTISVGAVTIWITSNGQIEVYQPGSKKPSIRTTVDKL